MKIVEKECYIPARTYIDKKYVASDGKEFIREIDCLEHERYLAIKSHPIYTTAIKDVDLFEEGYGATLYYLSSQEDYEYFKETQGFKTEHYFHSNFNKYGAGWYLYWSECGGDYPDNYYLKNYDEYEKCIESSWKEYKFYMRSRMGI